MRLAALLTLLLPDAMPAMADLQLLSVPDQPRTSASAAGGSYQPIVSADGQFVLFVSTAANLTPNSSNTLALSPLPLKMNVCRRDVANGTTTLVSMNLDGTGANEDCTPVAISTNGQFALFESSASDLAPGDTNGATDVFVRDLVAGTTVLVSVNTNGTSGDGPSSDSAMTPDGRFVAFASLATNLVSGDANGIRDVFVRDLQSGTTTLVSVNAKCGLWWPGSGGSWGGSMGAPRSSSEVPEITPDGRYVAFLSSATNLVPGVTTFDEVYVRDVVTGTTVVASTNAHAWLPYVLGQVYAFNHVISDDGQFVAFESGKFGSSRNALLFRQDLQTGTAELVATNALLRNSGQSFDMAPDGRFVAFAGSIDTEANTTTTGLFLWDAQAAATRLLSTNLNGAVPTNSVCELPVVDIAGQKVLFRSTALNLTTNPADGEFHLYVHELATGNTTLVDATTSGIRTNGTLYTHSLSADGRFVAFDSDSPELVTNDGNKDADVFLCELATGTTELVSAHDPDFPAEGPGLASADTKLSLSADGRYAAFSGTANDVLSGSTNRYRAVFVRDLLKGVNILASADTNGIANGNGASCEAVISGNGRYVAFSSRASNLVPRDSNRASDVFVRDLETGALTLVSTSWDLQGSGNGASHLPSISADGRYVLFYSSALNLVRSFSGLGTLDNLFLYDRVLRTNYALTMGSAFTSSMTPDGRYVAFSGSLRYGGSAYVYVWESQRATLVYTNTSYLFANVFISPSGRLLACCDSYLKIWDRIAKTNQSAGSISAAYPGRASGFKFSTDERYLVYSATVAKDAGDTNRFQDVYLYDLQAATNTLISRSTNSGFAPNAASVNPDISADGRFVTYVSLATDIVPSDNNRAKDVFLFDRQTGTTVALSASAYGTRTANRASAAPVFSGDGQTVLFQSFAMDLVDNGFNQGKGAFLLRLPSANPVFPGQIVYLPGTGLPPTLRWIAPPGKSYQVEFKNALTDSLWQPLNAEVSIVGDIGQAMDPAPNPGQKFYRIVAY